MLIGLRVVGLSLFEGDPNDTEEQIMATIEELISALLPLLPDAEVRIDNSGEVVVHTGLTVPTETAPTLTTRMAKG